MSLVPGVPVLIPIVAISVPSPKIAPMIPACLANLPAVLRFLNSINTSSNNIFLAGDTHNCWAGNIANNSGIFKGVEFGTPSVSSPGGSEEFGELDVRPLEKAVTKINKDLVWTNFRNRGYLTLKLKQNSGQVSFIGVNTVKNKIFERSVLRTFSLNPKEKII